MNKDTGIWDYGREAETRRLGKKSGKMRIFNGRSIGISSFTAYLPQFCCPNNFL
jgi:hypothetical protein